MSTLEIKSTVSKVTVYTDRAMVTRLAKTRLSADNRSIVIGNLPANLHEDSLRITGRGTAPMTILDFKVTRQEYRDVPEAALKTLQEEKERFQDEIAALRDEIAAIEHQKGFLQEIGVGKSKHFSKDLDVQRPLLDDWKSVLNFLGTEQRALDEARRTHELKIRKLETEIRLIEAELKKYAGVQSKTRKNVTIELELQSAGEFEFELAYLIKEASWKPMYDARVDTSDKRISIRYYGLVEQRTGEDWTGVEVMLSTARPQVGANVPTLDSWGFYTYTHQPSRNNKKSRGGGGDGDFAFEAEESLSVAEMGAGSAAYDMEDSILAQSSVEPGQGSSVVFRTPGRGDIPGDGGPSRLLIMGSDFEHRFQFEAAPALTEQVYLTAEITNSTDFPLLPGRISIYFDGNFIGHSDLAEVINPNEKFTLHLGADDSIKVRYKFHTLDNDSKGLLGRTMTKEYDVLITVESHRETAEEVIIHDRIPVSHNEKIKVEVLKLSPAENPEKDKDKLPTGIVEWKFKLAPKATQKLELKTMVSYPKDLEVYSQ